MVTPDRWSVLVPSDRLDESELRKLAASVLSSGSLIAAFNAKYHADSSRVSMILRVPMAVATTAMQLSGKEGIFFRHRDDAGQDLTFLELPAGAKVTEQKELTGTRTPPSEKCVCVFSGVLCCLDADFPVELT